jgi:hypothetical protein
MSSRAVLSGLSKSPPRCLPTSRETSCIEKAAHTRLRDRYDAAILNAQRQSGLCCCIAIAEISHAVATNMNQEMSFC